MHPEELAQVTYAYRGGRPGKRTPQDVRAAVRRTTLMFAACFTTAWLGISLAYVTLQLVLRDTPVHFPPVFMRVIGYWDRYPFQYIGVVSLSYALLATLWAVRWSYTRGGTRHVQMGGVVVLTALLSSLLGGLLWVYHDMLAGYFPEFQTMLWNLKWGAESGLIWGPAIMVVSFPLNVLGFIICFKATDFFARHYFPDSASSMR